MNATQTELNQALEQHGLRQSNKTLDEVIGDFKKTLVLLQASKESDAQLHMAMNVVNNALYDETNRNLALRAQLIQKRLVRLAKEKWGNDYNVVEALPNVAGFSDPQGRPRVLVRGYLGTRQPHGLDHLRQGVG